MLLELLKSEPGDEPFERLKEGHPAVAGSIEANPGIWLFTGPHASTDVRWFNVAAMKYALKDYLPNVVEYPMIEPDPSREKMNCEWDALELYCKKQTTVREEKSNYTLYSTPEYYQMNCLTLWVGTNKHMFEEGSFPFFPPGYRERNKMTDGKLWRSDLDVLFDVEVLFNRVVVE